MVNLFLVFSYDTNDKLKANVEFDFDATMSRYYNFTNKSIPVKVRAVKDYYN